MCNILTHNADLGVMTANLPPDKTCPGKSPWCKKYCYAQHGRWLYPNVQKSLIARWQASRRAGWVHQCTVEARLHADILRIHSAGDFYNRQYIQRWVQVARRAPYVQFYTYTRTWRCGAAWAESLRTLDSVPNMTVWLSVDPTTAHEARPLDKDGQRWRTAWVAGSDGAPAVNCLKQLHKGVENCRSCRRCFDDTVQQDICFRKH